MDRRTPNVQGDGPHPACSVPPSAIRDSNLAAPQWSAPARSARRAVLLVRAGLRPRFLCRTADQVYDLASDRRNDRYLPGVALPRELKIRALASRDDQFERPDLVFLAVPSKGLGEAVEDLRSLGVSPSAGIVSLAKGLVPPYGSPPTTVLEAAFGADRVACVGGPAHAREMVESGAGLVCASHSETLAHRVAEAFQRSGVVCEVSDDPVGVELAGWPRTWPRWRWAPPGPGPQRRGDGRRRHLPRGAGPRSGQRRPGADLCGPSGHGDLVATALAPTSRNRSAGELLAAGVPAAEIPARIGQAVEALETVRLLAHALDERRLEGPVTRALAELIEGTMPLEDWGGPSAGRATAAGALLATLHLVGPAARLDTPALRRAVSATSDTR